MACKAYIGLGSNWGASVMTLQAAAATAARLGYAVRGSSLYQSAPVGGVAQPPYVNAVLEIETAWRPEALWQGLRQVEQQFGRHRRERWGPRTLDLDLLLYDHWTIRTPVLVVPHPRLTERRFVLEPLAELAPDWVLPTGETVAQAFQTTLDQEVCRLDQHLFTHAGD